MCKVDFRDSVNHQKVSIWFSVEKRWFASCSAGSNKKILKKNHKRLREMVKQPEDWFDEQGYISFDPPCGGNFQFSSVFRILIEFGFQRSPEALRAETFSYLEANPNDSNGTPLDFYMDVSFSNYLNRMSIEGNFGNEMTLRAPAELFNIEFGIISTINKAVEATLTPKNFAPQVRDYLGHFAENHESSWRSRYL